jgi:hypothetical protein
MTDLALDVGVEFKGIAIKVETASVSFNVSRERLALNEADRFFCARRLQGAIIGGRKDDQDGQQTLIDDLDLRIEGSFDVKQFTCKAEVFSATASFLRKEVDLQDFVKLINKPGRIQVEGVEDIPEAEPSERTGPRSPAPPEVGGKYRDVPVHEIFAPGQANALVDFGVATFGEYLDRKNRLNLHWYEDIPRIGANVAAKMEETEFAFWSKNPQQDEESGDDGETADHTDDEAAAVS